MKSAVLLLALTFAALAHAQSMRTWVSGTGSDANPCSRVAPCATFAGALAQTNAGGEINCADSGEFGPMNPVDKSITIDCRGTVASIFVTGRQTAVIINAGPSDIVTIRNLSIRGPGNHGILYLVAKAVHLENVQISGVGVGCIFLENSGESLLTVDNATLSDCGVGIGVLTFSRGTAVVNVNNTRISNSFWNGVQAGGGSRVTIRNSTIYFSILQGCIIQNDPGFGTDLGSTVTVVNSALGYCNNAALQSLSGEFILAFHNTFVNNALDFNPNGGTIFTGSDNNNSGSTVGTANGGTVPKI